MEIGQQQEDNSKYNYSNLAIPWSEVTRKKARTSDNFDLGEVQQISDEYVTTVKAEDAGTQFFTIPKSLATSYNGITLGFSMTRDEALNNYQSREPSPFAQSAEASASAGTSAPKTEWRIPIVEERLNVMKKVVSDYVVITKIPVTEKRTVEVPVTYEKVLIERRPASEVEAKWLDDNSSKVVSIPATRGTKDQQLSAPGPVKTETKIFVPVSREELGVSKEPFVKEEVVVKKNPVTELRSINEEVRGETVKTEPGSKVIEKKA